MKFYGNIGAQFSLFQYIRRNSSWYSCLGMESSSGCSKHEKPNADHFTERNQDGGAARESFSPSSSLSKRIQWQVRILQGRKPQTVRRHERDTYRDTDNHPSLGEREGLNLFLGKTLHVIHKLRDFISVYAIASIKLLLIISVLVLSSCSASWHLKKACEKDPSICKSDTIVKVDTVTQYDTTYIETTADTTFDAEKTDSVVLQKGDLSVKYTKKGKQVSLTAKSKAMIITITHRIKEKTTITKTYKLKSGMPTWLWIVVIVLGLISLILMFLGAKRIFT